MNKDLSIIILGRILQIIIGFAAIRLLTTFLPPDELGKYYLVLAIVSFFNLVLLNPPSMYFTRHLLGWSKTGNILNSLFLFTIWINIVAIMAIPILITIYYGLRYNEKFIFSNLLTYTILAIIISTIHRNILYGTNILGYRHKFVFFLISTLFIALFLSSSFVYFNEAIALNWLMGVVCSEAITLYFIFKVFIGSNKLNLIKIKNELNRSRLKEILSFTIPISLTACLMWGQHLGYRFIVDYNYSAKILGYMGVGLAIANSIFSSIEAIAMQYFNPIFFKKILDASSQNRAAAWNEMAKVITPIYILTAIFVLAMSELIIKVLADTKFHDAHLYVSLGVGCEFFRVMTNLVLKVAHAEYRTIRTIKPYFIGLIISLVLLLSFDYHARHHMIVLALSFSYLCIFTFMYVEMKKISQISLMINVPKILVYSSPFMLVRIFEFNFESLHFNVFALTLFGSYFLYTTWVFTYKK